MIGITKKQKKIVPLSQLKDSNIPASRIDGSREWVSILGCVCADGSALTPAVIFKGLSGTVGENWLDEAMEEDRYWAAATEKGWTSNETGLNWLTEVFPPETKDKPNNRIRLLVLDGHSSHVNDKFFDQCDKLRIRVAILPPHSTHRLQPLDVGFFSPLSTAYTVIANQQYNAFEGRLRVNKSIFFGNFLRAWKKAVTEATIKSAWKKAGLIPHDRSILCSTRFSTSLLHLVRPLQFRPPIINLQALR